LTFGRSGYKPGVRVQVLAMSAATIDPYVIAERERLAVKGISTTEQGAVLRTSIIVPKAGDEVENGPSFVQTDTVTHCGPTLQSTLVRTLTMTDVVTGVGPTRRFTQ